MERRPYGTTGENLSIIGFGGIVVMQADPGSAARWVAEAVDRGVNYFDVAPTYGNAEERLGPALAPHRQGVFLACKTTQRLAAGVRDELHTSLTRLHTDRFDLYQLHAVNTAAELQQVTGPGGALEAVAEARQQGKIRYVGFSSHSVETALALLDHGGFDSVLFPVNWGLYLQAGFGPQVVARAQELGVARLALKAMAAGKLAEGAAKRWTKCWYQPLDEVDRVALALRFALSQPITAALPPGEAELFRLALEVAERFTPVTADEVAELRQQAAATEPLFSLAAS